MGGGSRRGTVVPKKLAPSAAVTGVLRLSSIFPNGSSLLPGSDLSKDREARADGEEIEGNLKISLLELELPPSVGDDGGLVAAGGEKHRRLSETQGNTRDFFRSGTSGLVPGLGK